MDSIKTLFPMRNQTQNNHILDRISCVHMAVLHLAREGHTIERIEIEGKSPVIWVQHTQHCQRLKGVWYRREPGPLGPRYTHQADVDGCRVQWTTIDPSLTGGATC